MVSPIREEIDNSALNIADYQISIFPNPVNSIIGISSNEVINKIELFDITGKSVRTISTSSEKVSVDLSSLIKGVYIGKIYLNTGEVTTRKIVKN
jgi:hypothetical protein